jgi:hypothetical protein
MGEATFPPTEQDRQRSRLGKITQFEGMFDEATQEKLINLGIMKFIDHEAEVDACKEANIRMLQNALNELT